jgi:ABC-type multidrug transport system fused ATPase/permease subunit
MHTVLGLLGHLWTVSGTISCRGTVAYVPQSAFIVAGTVRHNILFGRPMHSARYAAVLDVCCLVHDLEQLPQVGRHGLLCSGLGMRLGGGGTLV